MSAESIASIVGVSVIGIGLIATWVRNGRSQAKGRGVLETEIRNVKDKLDDEYTGLGAIKTAVDEQRLNCAEISSGFRERIKNLEKKPTK